MVDDFQQALLKRGALWTALNFIGMTCWLTPLAFLRKATSLSDWKTIAFQFLFAAFQASLLCFALVAIVAIMFYSDRRRFGATSLKFSSGKGSGVLERVWVATYQASMGLTLWKSFYFLFEGDKSVWDGFLDASHIFPLVACIVSLHTALEATNKKDYTLKDVPESVVTEYMNTCKRALKPALGSAGKVGLGVSIICGVLKVIFLVLSLFTTRFAVSSSSSDISSSSSSGITLTSRIWDIVLYSTVEAIRLNLVYIAFTAFVSSAMIFYCISVLNSSLVTFWYHPLDFTKLTSSGAAWQRALNPKVSALEDPTVRYLSVGFDLSGVFNALVKSTGAGAGAYNSSPTNTQLSWKVALKQQLDCSQVNLIGASKAFRYDPACLDCFGENTFISTQGKSNKPGNSSKSGASNNRAYISTLSLFARCMAAQDMNRLLRGTDKRRREKMFLDCWTTTAAMLSTNVCIDALSKQLKLLEKFTLVIMDVAMPPPAHDFDVAHNVSEAVNINRISSFVRGASTRPAFQHYNAPASSSLKHRTGTSRAVAKAALAPESLVPGVDTIGADGELINYGNVHDISAQAGHGLELHHSNTHQPAQDKLSIASRMYSYAAVTWHYTSKFCKWIIPAAVPRWFTNRWDRINVFFLGTIEEQNRRRLCARLAYSDQMMGTMWCQFMVHTVENSALLLERALVEDKLGYCKAYAFPTWQSLLGVRANLLKYSTVLQQAEISAHGIARSGRIGGLRADRFGAGGNTVTATGGHRLQHMMRRSMKHESLSAGLICVAEAVEAAISCIEEAYGDILRSQNEIFEQQRLVPVPTGTH